MAEAKKKTPPSPKPKRRRLWLKLLLLFGVLLVLAVLFGPMLVPGSTLGRIAASLAEGSLKRETTIESASFNVFSGFHAEGIEVQRRDGFGNGTLVEIGKVSGTIDYAAFLRLNVGIAQVSVEDVDASIVRDKEGVLNIQDLLDQPKSAITLTVGRVQAKDVKVTVRDKGLDITQSVKVAEADISAASDGKRTLSVSTKLPSGGTAVIEGTANLPADLAFKGADVTVVVEGFPALRVANEVARLTKFRSDREKAWIESFEQALVDAKLTVTVSAEKTATVEGTATVRELPELPEFGFTDADRTLALTLKGDGSIEKQHIELAAAAADAPFLTATVDATAESDTKRLVTLKAALPDGFTTDVNASIITTDEGEFASAEATLKVASSPAAALGLKLLRTLPLAPGVREQVDNAAGHIRKAGAEGIRVDADLQIVGFAERRIQIDGTVTARDLPAIPQLAFEGDERRVDLTLTGVVISPKKQHIELAIASQPGNALRARAVIDPIDETVAAFNLDNYTIDALLEVAADFAQGGLPGTPLAAGKATTRITVTGDLSGLEIKTDAALADGKVTLSADTAADLPPLTLAADAVVAPFDFTATLRKATLETEGFATTATGALKPIEADVNVGAVMPALEFQADAVTTGDFSKLPQALRKLIGMAADGAMKGTLEEKAKILVRTHALKDWKDAAKLRQVLDTVTVTGGLDVRQFAFQDAAPADLKATFDATARAADLSVTFRETAIQGPGIQGSLNGTLRLAKDAAPSELPGRLAIDLATLAKQYGSLLGLPAGLEVRGAIASDVTIRREGAFVDAKGAATVTDLFLGGEAWKGNPVVEKLAKAVYDTRLDIDKMTLTIGAFDVASSRATAKAKGVLVLPGGEGKSDFKLQAAADMALAKLIPGLPEPLRIREGSGWVDVACTVKGDLDDLIIAGSSATREGGLKIATSELAVQGNFTRTFTITRKGDLIDAKVEGEATDFLATSKGWTEPIREAKLAGSAHVTLDLGKQIVGIEQFDLTGKLLAGTAKGSVVLPGGEGKSSLAVDGRMDMALAKLLPGLTEALTLRSITGQAKGTLKLEGEPRDLTVTGSGTLENFVVDGAVGVKAAVASTFSGTWKDDAVSFAGSANLTGFEGTAAGLAQPLREDKLTASARVVYDLGTHIVSVEQADLAGKLVAGAVKGTVVLPGGKGASALAVDGRIDMALAKLVPGLSEALGLRSITGQAKGTLTLEGKPRALTIAGSAAMDRLVVDAKVGVKATVASAFEGAWKGDVVTFTGTTDLTGFEGTSPRLAKPLIEEKLTLSHALDVDLAKGEAKLTKLAVTGKLVQLQGTGGANFDPAKGTLKDLSLDLQGTAAADLVGLLPELPAPVKDLKAIGKAAFALKLGGTPDALRASGSVDAAPLLLTCIVTLGGSDYVMLMKPPATPAGATFQATLAKEVLTVPKATLTLGATTATLTASAPLDLSKFTATLKAPEVDLTELGRWVPVANLYEPQGAVDVDIQVAGTPKDPKLGGRILLQDCSACLTEAPNVRTTANGKILLNGADLTVEKLTVAMEKAKATINAQVRGVTTYPKTNVTVAVEAGEVDLARLLEVFTPPPPPAGMAPAAAPPAAPGAVALPAFTLPTLPPELSATIMANVAAVTFDGRRAESIVVVGKLTNQYLELSPVTAKPLGGTAAAAIRVQFGGAFQHAIGVQASGVKVSESFDVLSKIPVFKSIFVAMFAGTPEKVDFTAAADGQLTTQGNTLAAMHANLNSPGKGVKAVLTDLTVKGSPMFAAVAAYTNHPELANMTFKQVDAPVLVANGAVRTNPSVTMPYEEGVFLVTGGTTRDLMANFQMTVKDPAGIRFIPGKVHDYLAAGHPLVIVSGTVLEPKPKVPTQQILTYIAQRALFKRDKKDPKGPKDDKKDTKEKVIEGVLDGLFKRK